jgi:flagellar assembly factor FliW
MLAISLSGQPAKVGPSTTNALLGAAMTTSAAPNPAETIQQQPALREVSTRFGKVTVNKEKAVHFAKGFVGMPDKQYFCMVDFPVTKLPRFKLMQCLTDDELAFMVLPIELTNEFIESEDIAEACKTLSIDEGNLGMALVVTIHRRVNAVSLSVNARAPIFIDTAKLTAAQYVLPNNKYEIRQMISSAGVVLEGTYDD